MKKRVVVSTILICSIFVFVSSNAYSMQLGNIKGCVVDYLSGKPVGGVEVIGNTNTNIENELKYKTIRTKSDNKGMFSLKGIRDKSYNIVFDKKGYYQSNINETIPRQSNLILDRKVKLLTSITESGIYLFSDKLVPLTRTKPDRHVINIDSWRKDTYIYYSKKELETLKPQVPKYLLFVGYRMNDSDYSMYYLLGHSSIDNFDKYQDHGDEYYSTGPQFRGCGGFRSGNETFYEYLFYGYGNYNMKRNYCSSERFWYNISPMDTNYQSYNVYVYDITNIMDGFYHVGYASWKDNYQETAFVFKKGR